MKMMSVSEMKGQFKRAEYVEKPPREGTRLREIYDMFKEKPGLPIHWSTHTNECIALGQLRDFYGLDIRRVDKHRRGLWILAGEWFGSRYRDYVQERLRGEDVK